MKYKYRIMEVGNEDRVLLYQLDYKPAWMPLPFWLWSNTEYFFTLDGAKNFIRICEQDFIRICEQGDLNLKSKVIYVKNG